MAAEGLAEHFQVLEELGRMSIPGRPQLKAQCETPNGS